MVRKELKHFFKDKISSKQAVIISVGILFILFFLFLLFFLNQNKNKLDNKKIEINKTGKNIDVVPNVISFKEKKSLNKEEEKLVKEGKIKKVKINLSYGIIKHSEQEIKKNVKIPKNLILTDYGDNKEIPQEVKKYEEIEKTVQELAKNSGDYLFAELLELIKNYNKQSDYLKIDYNKFLLFKNKKNIIIGITNTIYSDVLQTKTISEYLERSKENLLEFINYLNNILNDFTGKDIFKIKFDIFLINDIKFKKYKDGFGLVNNEKLNEIFNNLLNQIKEKNKEGKISEKELMYKFLEQNSSLLLDKDFKDFSPKTFNTILTILTIIDYNFNYYNDLLDEKSFNVIKPLIVERIKKELIKKVKMSNLTDWDKSEIINIINLIK